MLAAVLASLLAASGAIVTVIGLQVRTVDLAPDERRVYLLVGGGAVLAGLFVLTVLAVS